jgi:tRNA dimethylallyltransferase
MTAHDPASSSQATSDRTFPPLRDVWYLSGPTASGKTAVAIELAQRIGAEIISMDSMAVFRGMDVGTAKPGPALREVVPHHLLDIVDPDCDFSLANFVQLAHAAAAEIRSRGRQVLLVGGTPLYLKALLRGVFTGPAANWEFRLQLERDIENFGVQALHERLQLVDPLAAAKLHPHDKRRIVRALEVSRQVGTPLSHLQTQFDESQSRHRPKVFALQWPRAILHQRIEDRVEAMFQNGLVAEVSGLLERHGVLSRTATQAVGYREVLEFLRGERDLVATKEKVKARSRQFARRQETWYRSLDECTRIDITDAMQPAEISRQILDRSEVITRPDVVQ